MVISAFLWPVCTILRRSGICPVAVYAERRGSKVSGSAALRRSDVGELKMSAIRYIWLEGERNLSRSSVEFLGPRGKNVDRIIKGRRRHTDWP
jgi:hypothetical protein